MTTLSGEAHILARARLMLLLGDQLITDEAAAVSELVKNAYDADAAEVEVTLSHVSDQTKGFVRIRDNGHGMSREVVLSSWLELATLSKARGLDLAPRYSEKGRLYLGEKGLGRLAVHKIGEFTELVTRRKESATETRLVLDWSEFEASKGYLQEVPVTWQESEPSAFLGSSHGTQLTMSKLRRAWDKDTIRTVQRSLSAMKSPFAELSKFEIKTILDGELASESEEPNIADLVRKGTYTFLGQVDHNGVLTYQYRFQRPDLRLSRKMDKKIDIRGSEDFKPVCGLFRIRLYSWDLRSDDLKAVFLDPSLYTELIKPNTGVKVFRDGFRVLPYGSEDNDWLGMDLERVRGKFQRKVSRNQVIGVVEISSVDNPLLIDKSDREGLINNDSFKHFFGLVRGAVVQFEAERYVDHERLKVATGRKRDERYKRALFLRQMTTLSKAIHESKLDAETKLRTSKVLSEIRNSLDVMLGEREDPLLVAASLGLTYMMPTHEVRRDVREALKIMRQAKDAAKPDKIDAAISLLKQADSTVGGLGRLMQRTDDDEVFPLEDAAKSVMKLMRYRMDRNGIVYEIDPRKPKEAKGAERMVIVLLMNLMDNSIYWVSQKKPGERRIKIIVDEIEGKSVLVVSDSGPGFQDDDIETLTLPFFTRKPNGMGLGLYIADRIARNHGGRLKLLSDRDLPGLLPGANIAVLFPEVRGS